MNVLLEIGNNSNNLDDGNEAENNIIMMKMKMTTKMELMKMEAMMKLMKMELMKMEANDEVNENEEDNESYGFSDETYCDEDLSTMNYIKSNIVYDLFTHKYIQLHIFQKNIVLK